MGPLVSRGGRLVRRREPFTFAALERVLAPGERIFTSMDVRPITSERVRSLDDVRDAKLVDRMRELARDVYREFNLSSLVRLDLRADEKGDLHILEANPKPDLKKPQDGVTNLISAGLPQAGLSYEDVVLSLLADRLDNLFTHRRAAGQHILDLLDGASAGGHRLGNGGSWPPFRRRRRRSRPRMGSHFCKTSSPTPTCLRSKTTLKTLRNANGAVEAAEGATRLTVHPPDSTDDMESRIGLNGAKRSQELANSTLAGRTRACR